MTAIPQAAVQTTSNVDNSASGDRPTSNDSGTASSVRKRYVGQA